MLEALETLAIHAFNALVVCSNLSRCNPFLRLSLTFQMLLTRYICASEEIIMVKCGSLIDRSLLHFQDPSSYEVSFRGCFVDAE